MALIVLSSLGLSAQPWFGYYGNAIQDPTDRVAQMREHATYSNTTMAVRWWVEADWQAAKDADLRVILQWPHEFWLTVDAGTPLLLDLPMWCRMSLGEDPGWCNQTAADWLSVVLTHRDEVAYIGIVDEYDCGVPYSQWLANRTNCRTAAAKIEANVADARLYLPGIPLHVNYTATWASLFTTTKDAPWRRDYYGIYLSSADYVGFDCYTPFDRCARDGVGIYGVPTLIANLERVMTPEQRIVLIPRAFNAAFLNWAPSPETVAAMAWQYQQYMQGHPRVVGMMPFIWWDLMGPGSGAMHTPAIRHAYEQIGMRVTGRPGPPPPSAPTGLRILQES